jgi:hypothetical protein
MMKRRSSRRPASLWWILVLLVCVANIVSVAQEPKPVTQAMLLELIKENRYKQNPGLLIEEWIQPNKINFIPTQAVLDDLKNKGVAKEVLNSLRANFASRIILLVFQFDCDNCSENQARQFSRKLLVAIRNTVLARNLDSTDPLYRKTYYGSILDTQTFQPAPAWGDLTVIGITGTLAKHSDGFNIDVSFSHILQDNRFVPLGTKQFTSISSESFQVAANQVSTWIKETLESATMSP